MGEDRCELLLFDVLIFSAINKKLPMCDGSDGSVTDKTSCRHTANGLFN